MDEQTMQQPMSSAPEDSGTWSSEADGLAYGDYDDASESNNEPISIPTESYNADEYPSEAVSSGDGNVTLTPEGDLEFKDEFFDNIGNDDPVTPKPYTQDELKSTPFEYWDVNRLEGDIRDYVPIVRDQMMRRQMEQQLSMRPETPPIVNAPQQYTPKELAEAAQKLACEKLGLDDPDDFDEYEGEHQAALNLAMQELSQQRNAELAAYQRVSQGYQDLQNFNAALVRQPDYIEFDRWFSGKLQEAGVTAAQVNAGLQEYARRSGGDYNSLKGVISGWYQEFQQEKRAQRGTPIRRANRPPVLESPRGNSYEGRRTMDMRKFGSLDEDAQARALMRMGIV